MARKTKAKAAALDAMDAMLASYKNHVLELQEQLRLTQAQLNKAQMEIAELEGRLKGHAVAQLQAAAGLFAQVDRYVRERRTKEERNGEATQRT